MSDETFGADLAADLRDLANAVEKDNLLAGMLRTTVTTGLNLHPSWDFADRKESVAAGIRALKHHFGTVAKDYDTDLFKASVRLRVLGLDLLDTRENVCRAVVTGTREVEVPDPGAPRIKKTEDVIEWVCEPILADSEEVES